MRHYTMLISTITVHCHSQVVMSLLHKSRTTSCRNSTNSSLTWLIAWTTSARYWLASWWQSGSFWNYHPSLPEASILVLFLSWLLWHFPTSQSFLKIWSVIEQAGLERGKLQTLDFLHASHFRVTLHYFLFFNNIFYQRLYENIKWFHEIDGMFDS